MIGFWAGTAHLVDWALALSFLSDQQGDPGTCADCRCLVARQLFREASNHQLSLPAAQSATATILATLLQRSRNHPSPLVDSTLRAARLPGLPICASREESSSLFQIASHSTPAAPGRAAMSCNCSHRAKWNSPLSGQRPESSRDQSLSRIVVDQRA